VHCVSELHVPANLLIGKELDCRIGHNPDTVGAIALKHPFYALPLIHVLASLDAHLASNTIHKTTCMRCTCLILCRVGRMH